MEKVTLIAFLNSADYMTKEQIKLLAVDVMNDALNNGMIKPSIDAEGMYESVFAKDIILDSVK